MSRADDLKKRRARVAALKGKGSTYKEIAKELGITVGIVASDLRAVKREGAGADEKSTGASKSHARAKTGGTATGAAKAKTAHEGESAKPEAKSTEAADLLKHADKTIRSLAPAEGDADWGTDWGDGKHVVNPSLAKLAAPVNEPPAPPTDGNERAARRRRRDYDQIASAANGNERAARRVSSADDPRFRERQYFESLNDNEKYDYLVNRRNEDRFLLVSVVIIAAAALILICL